ncbi:MAG: hypothetical protein WEA99_01120 [Brumimicrobium sp.]
MRGAVIDLGTNTFNLIIFDKKGDHFEVLSSHKNAVNLGMGGINESMIAPDAKERALKALREYSAKCHELGVQKIKAFGTSALRGAKNARDLISIAKKELNIDISVIDGMAEASLIYEGVKSVHEFKKPSCIMDIGGGSTEFILIDNGAIITKKSYDIGVSRIIQKFELSDPLSHNNIQEIYSFFEHETNGFFKSIKSHDLIGASGSFETFFELVTGEKEFNLWKSTLIPFEKLIEKLDLIIASSFKERQNSPQIPEFRQIMIHVAALKTKWIIEQLEIRECYISPASLKEGVIHTEF